MSTQIISKILVIDDDKDIGEIISTTATRLGFNCTATTNVTDFLVAINPTVTLLMIDLMIPGIDGIELLRKLGKQQCKTKIILMSGVDKRVLETAQSLASSLGLSIVEIIQKPFRVPELKQILLKHSNELSSNAARVILIAIQAEPIIEITKHEIQRAIECEEFVLYYQPQIDIVVGRISGLEALVRWQHPERGLIYPDAFISKLEAFGLIDQLGWLVAKRGLREIQQFTRADGTIPTLSLNVSPYSLHDLKFPDIFSDIAMQCNVDPENIIIEITESGLFSELSSALDILARLRMKNFKLSIDDFGTGYAMMEQLQRVPATELKIDKSLVQAMNIQDSSRIMVKKIIEMGHELGMRVIAEGVETAEQIEFMRNNHCDLIQGYFFTKPLPIPELLDWIRKFEHK